MSSPPDAVHSRGCNIKRKLDDFPDDVFLLDGLVPAAVRMRKDQFTPAFLSDCSPRPLPPASRLRSSSSSSSSSPSESTRSLTRLQFFVRMISGGNTMVFHADSSDPVKSIHERIQAITGIPLIEQRLIYRGKQLQWEQSLADCNIQNDAGLQLVGRMRSTGHPQAWQLVNDMVSQIFSLCKNETLRHSNRIKSRLMEFISMTPKTDHEQAAGHLQIFLSSCAPAALVMLYMSPVKSNRDCADDSIRQFINSSKSVLPKPRQLQCAHILLEFCKLLSVAAGSNDALYILCRSSLGSIVESSGFAKGEVLGKENIEMHEVFPFLSEIGGKLSMDLVAYNKETKLFMGPLSSDVRDFTSFLVPIRDAIQQRVASRGAITLPGDKVDGAGCSNGGDYSFPCYAEEIKLLHGIYTDLFEKMDQGLKRMEELLEVKERGEGEALVHLGWSQYLAILRELYFVSKLYKGKEKEFWEMMRHRKVSLCYLIVRFAKRSDDHQWILDHKEVTNFEARRHLAILMLPEVKDEYDELHEMLIDRSQLLAESFEYIAHTDPESLRGGLFMEFKNEEATGPGVLREWFFLVCNAIFNPQNALFVACPNDRRRFFPNPASKVDPLHLEYFTFSGRVIALALMHKVQVGVVFDRVFFLQLAGKNVSLEDIRDADPYLYNSCKQILEMDPETVDQDALGLTFVREVEELGSRKVVELCPDGKTRAVNSKNRKQYVDLLIQHRFVTSIAEQIAHFAQGFADITSSRVQKSFFHSLDLEDFDWILYGSETAVSVEDWKIHTEYNGFKETDPQIFWFWKIVEQMSAEQRKVLLFFWTSIKYLPVEGFGGLASRLYIYRTSEPYEHLPSSHTCFYRLCFPPYPSLSVMQDRLRIITQEHVGCSFGTW